MVPGRFFADGQAVLTATATPDSTRELLATGRICAIGKYTGMGFTLWDSSNRAQIKSVRFASDMGSFASLSLIYLFYSCTAIASVAGLGNLSSVTSMRFTLSSRSGLTELDARGFVPSSLSDLYYTFGGGVGARKDLRGCHLGAAFQRHIWELVLLQLPRLGRGATGPLGPARRRCTHASASTRRRSLVT